MDNFTHSLAGWAVGQTGLKSKSRKGLAALILGANMPDIDVFLGSVSYGPLATHRGWTHGLFGGVLLLPPVLAALLWLLDRWQVKRGETFKSGLTMRFGWLVTLAYIGTLTHPLLDLQNTYAVQLLSPLDLGWFHNDTLFIIDVWIWTALSFAIWLSRRREKKGGDWRRPAVIAVAAVVAYIGANSWISGRAKTQLLASGLAKAPDAIFAGQVPVKFWLREVVWRENGMIGKATYLPFHSIVDVQPLVPDGMADPLAREGMSATPRLTQFMRWSILPTAIVTRSGCEATVTYGDARYTDPRARSSFRRVARLRNNQPGCR